ncbi:MAG: 16S rRNA (cytosine(1402)-N(4))-methyltransferase RsmH [Chloroflexi bacterium]|nr:16S rRNA (cytosine(1402)-N(4))-methyltransferase RsmH [Chloroflexota bacterium]
MAAVEGARGGAPSGEGGARPGVWPVGTRVPEASSCADSGVALYYHTPVLLQEVAEALAVRPGGQYIDCTVGEGGHAEAILVASAPGGRLLGMDADPEAVAAALRRLASYAGRAILVQGNFSTVAEVAEAHHFRAVDGILFDLGLSSLQLEGEARGYSFRIDSPLDMRTDPSVSLTAAEVVNTYSEERLARVLATYGEETRARLIARAIVRSRPVRTSLELARAVEQAVGRLRGRLHPATRTFQAVRIEVNRELEHLEAALREAIPLLGKGGRLVVISYHSLEDRLVKGSLRQAAARCKCPPRMPVCICGSTPELRLVRRKVVTPSPEEVRRNPRSRSARLRVAERL